MDSEAGKIPLDGWDIYFFVPRSFSLLPFGEGWFENGRAELEFPTTIPGDTIGNLTINFFLNYFINTQRSSK